MAQQSIKYSPAFAMATTQSPQKFDQRSWRIIKEFSGIYGIKMDYTNIIKLSRDKLSNVYFKISKFPISKVSVTITITYDCNGKPDIQENLTSLLQLKSTKEWKAIILKRIAKGYKNKKLYEELAKLMAPPPKVACVCGLKIGVKEHHKYAHYRTRAHVNRMLQCVPLSKVVNSSVPTWDQMGNSHTLVVRKWSNQHRRYLRKQIDLRTYMERREVAQSKIHSYLASASRDGSDTSIKLTAKMKKQLNWVRTYYTMDDILVGGWIPC